MNKEEQGEAYQEIQDYLQQNNVHGIFSQLVQQVMLHKPANLLDFAIEHLQQPSKVTMFVVGPPGLNLNPLIQKGLATSNQQFEVFNFGQELQNMQKLFKDETDRARLKDCRLVSEEAIGIVVDKLQKQLKSNKNYIVEGFPKNLKQALMLQHRGIYTKNILFLNVHVQHLLQLCSSKVQQKQPDLQAADKNKLVEQMILEYHICINEVKQFYQQYTEIDLCNNKEDDFIVNQLNKAFSLKTIQNGPRSNTQILIVGSPFSGRTTLGKKLAEHYNLVYISTSFLIAEEIRKDTIHGRKVKEHFINNKLVDNFLVQKLIEERINKKDCRMQGFILEGYPKSAEQFENIKNMRLNLTMVVALDSPQEASQARSNISSDALTQRFGNWKTLAQHLKESKEPIYWPEPTLGINNLFQEVVHQIEKQFI